MKLTLASTDFGVALSFCLSALAQTTTVCVADQAARCPGKFDVHIGCTDASAWASSVCKIQGSSEPAKFQVIPGAGGSGGQCGYRVATVVCR